MTAARPGSCDIVEMLAPEGIPAQGHMGLAPLHQELQRQRVSALQAFHAQVTAPNFTCAEQSIGMHVGEEGKLLEALYKW